MRKPRVLSTQAAATAGTIVYFSGSQEDISLFADWIKNTLSRKDYVFLSSEVDNRSYYHTKYLIQRDEDLMLIKLKWL